MDAAWDDCVGYHPWVTVTFTSDLVSRIRIESGAYFVCGCILDGGFFHIIFRSLKP